MSFFNATRLKVQIKLAINRLRLLQQKKVALNLASRAEIATLLEKGKEESARIKVENIIREDLHVEALELLELYIEVLHARLGLLDAVPIDAGLIEAVQTIIYAAPRCDVKELSQVREQLLYKFGREFAQAAMDNTFGTVNSRVVDKLRIEVPAPELVDSYLAAIAKAYQVEWEAPKRAGPPGRVPLPMAGAGATAMAAEGPSPLAKHKWPLLPELGVGGKEKAGGAASEDEGDGPPAFQSNPNLALEAEDQERKELLPPTPDRGADPSSNGIISGRTPSQAPSTASSSQPDFDALSARFEALKRRA